MSDSNSPARVAPTRRGWIMAAAAAGLAVAFQLWGLYWPSGPSWGGSFAGADKVAHAIAFALPVSLIALAYALRRRAAGRPPRIRVLLAVAWLFVLHAVLSELIQHAFYPGRTGDPLDVLADWSGIVVGGLAVWQIVHLRLIALGPVTWGHR